MKLLTTKLLALLAIFASAFAVPSTSSAQTALSAGDVAIMGYNASGTPDRIALLILKDLAAGTVFYVNDNEVSTDGGTAFADASEVEATFTVQAGQSIAAGTVVVLPWGNEAVTSSVYTWTGHTSGGLGASGGVSLDDGLYVYQGATATTLTPTTFIFHLKGSAASATNGGNRPSGLTAGDTSIQPTSNTTRYKTTGATYSGTRSALRTAIANFAANWEGSAPVVGTNWTFTVTTPTITGAGTASVFTTTYGTASAPQTFPISGSSLTADITATAPAGFEVSSDGETFGSSATFTQSGGTASGTVRLQLKADAAVTGSYNSLNVALTSTGATTVNITTAASGNAVTAAALTITGVSGVNKPYDGGTTASLSGTPAYVGLKNSESFSVTGTAVANFETAAVGNGKTITVTSYTAPTTNYTVSQPTGLAGNITAVALTITASDVIKPQGQTLTDGTGYTNFTTDGLVNSETVGSVTVAYGAGGATGAAAGSYPDEVTISGATGGTFTPSNYDPISYVPGDITVSASPTINTTGALAAVDTTYGTASATPTNFSITGAFLTNDITVTAPANYEVSTSIGSDYDASVLLRQSGGTVAATTIYVRLAATAPVTGSPHGGNVVLSSTGATPVNVATVASAVAAKNLTISGLSGANKEYDRNNTASFTGTPALVGIIGSDDVSLAGTPASTFADFLVGVAKPITVTGYTLAGTAAPNYTLTQPTGLTADITAKALTVTGAAVTTKPLDGTDTATITGTLVGIISPDVVTLVGTGNFVTAGPGTGIAVTSTSTLAGANAGNYSLTQPVGLTGNITAGTNANLSDLTVSSGTLSPLFPLSVTQSVTNFAHVVPNGTANVTVTPTTADAFATVTVNGTAVGTGTSSSAISLNPGLNTINLVVTAQDTVTTKPYTITVIRQSSAALSPGSIAFTGFNADGNDNLAFVALTTIPANTVIFFSEEEWTGTDWSANTEACYAWTASSAIAAGTIVTIDNTDQIYTAVPSPVPVSNLGVVTPIRDANNGSNIAASDEAVVAFQGTGALNTGGVPVPTSFLALIANEDAAGTGFSLTSTGLSEAAGTAIIFVNDDDGMRYKGLRSGEAAFSGYLPLIANKATNWDTIGAGDGTSYVPFSATAFTTSSPGEVSIAAASVTEGNSGTVTLSLPVTRTNTATAFTVQYAVTGGTATSGTDYVALASGTLTFTNGGSASQNIDITVNGDTDVEGNETVTVTLSNVVNTTGLTVLTTASASGTINTDDNIPVTYPPTNALTGTVKGSITLTGAEISAFDPASKRAFATSNGGIQVVNLTNPAAPTLITNIAPASLGVVGLTSNDVSSVALRKAVGATPAVLAATVLPASKLDNGHVIFLNPATGALLGSVVVGQNPDHVCFTPDGTKVLVANEGEPNGASVDVAADTTVGSVSIIDISGGLVAPTVSTAGFAAFDTQVAALRAAGVRIFKNSGGTDAVPSTEFEPEYIAISPGGTTAMVTLQEANAVAVLNIATATFTSIVPMGQKNYSAIRTDLSDRDNGGTANLINPVVGNPVFGLYMPDAIGSYSVAGQTYYVTANEGDDRNDFLTPDETTTVANGSYDLDNTVFPNELDLKTNAKLGRLTVSNSTGLRGDTDGDGDIDQILSYGARSFSILDAAGNIVFDSGDMIEMIVASQHASNFDDSRSDNKGPEPEGITIATIGARTYAFVALERSGMVLAFDVTNPAAVTHTTAFKRTGDQNPEGLLVVSAADSPTGKPLLLSSNETSLTLTIFEIDQAVDYKLQVLHYYGESGLLGIQTAPIMGAMIDKFDDQYGNTVVIGEGDSYIPGPWLIAGADPVFNNLLHTTAQVYSGNNGALGVAGSFNPAAIVTSAVPFGRADIAIMNAFGTTVSALGNHEFDLGSPVLASAIYPATTVDSPTSSAVGNWVGAKFPHITANLTFAGDSSLRGRADLSLGGVSGTANNAPNVNAITAGTIANLEVTSVNMQAKIAPYAIKTINGQRIGFVGATNWDLLSKTSPNGTVPKDDANAATSDLQEVAAYLQGAVNSLQALGVTKIIQVDQLDDLQRNKDLAPLVSGIDIVVAGGGHERMGDSTDVPVAFNGHDADFIADAYPITTAGADGKPVLIVTTDTEYSYLGRLVADFDADGVLILPNLSATINGAYASTEANLQAAYATADSAATIIAGSTIGSQVKTIVDAINNVVVTKDGNVYGYTDVYLEGDRVFGRTQEVNLGNITADANAVKARAALGLGLGDAVFSLKNGGGIRASVGSVLANGTKVAPIANPLTGKPAGGISQLDVENALRFDNKLMVFDATPLGLKNILEYASGLSSGPTAQNGGYPQVGNIRFAYDSTQPAGSRLRSAALVNEAGQIVAKIVENGAVLPTAPATIKCVALSFTANGGDNYPIKYLNPPTNTLVNNETSNFRLLLTNGGLAASVARNLDFTAATTYTSLGLTAADVLGEQKAFQDFLAARHPSLATAYNTADTAVALDTRIQQKAFRTDTVLSGPATFAAWLGTNGYTSAGLLGDTDSNGTPDILEYFFNQNPNDGGDLGNLPRLSRNGSDLELQFTVNSTSVYSGVLQVTGNLVNWRDAVEGTDYQVISVITSGGETTYRYRVLASGSVPKFFQLELVDAP